MKNQQSRPGFWPRVGDQLGSSLLREYLIPVETNNFWYALGGILGIALVMQFLTGFIILFKYIPDAGLAFGITQSLIDSPTWHIILNFHYWDSFLIAILLVLHIMRVFISGAYRGNKKGLWFVGLVLAGLLFMAYTTGEALHWDETGFAVPWHVSEFFQAIGLADFFSYTFSALKAIPTATAKLAQIYSLHIAVIPILIVLALVLHVYLIKEKRISQPFWKKPSGNKAPFMKHVKLWFAWSAIILGALLFIAAFVPRNAGVAPQLLPSSPYYGSPKGPGKLGAKPSFPISWTHGMNVFVGEHLGLEPDIWGTVIGMALMLGALILIPFVDKGKREPKDTAAVFDWKTRGWAFALVGFFWLIFLIGVIQNAIAGPG